jgi:cytochrome P450
MKSPLLWRPLEPANIRDPYSMYKTLRQTDPIHLAQTQEYIITRYEDVKEILKSPSFQSGNRLEWLKRGVQYFDNKDEDFRAIYQAMNSFILMLNDEHHMRIRNFVTKTWSNRKVDDIIHSNIRLLLTQLKTRDFDFILGYAQPLPVYTISRILGVPVTDCQHLIQLGVAMTKTLDLYVSMKDLVLMNKAASDFIAFFREQIKAKYDNPDDGLLSQMIERNRSESPALSEEELISIAIFLFTAGEETSASLISNALLNLLKHPDQFNNLRRSPELIDSAIEEVLRYDSVVQLLGRVAKEDVVVGGKTIPANATVTLVVASANRDELAFEEADEFIITRKPNRHLSFGTGKHFCLGDWLGRRQSQLAMDAFIKHFPDVTLPEQELTWYKNIAVRRLNTLQVRVSN